MMLRNKSPVATAAASLNPKSSINANSANNIASGNCNIIDDYSVSRTGEANKDLASSAKLFSSALSPQPKLTHRRGFSHGSLNANANPNILFTNSPLNYAGRAANSSLEVQLSENSKRNYPNQHHLASNTFIARPYDQSNLIMKTTSNDHLPSDDNSGSYHSSSLHHTSSHHNTTANEEQIIKEKAIARIEDKIIRIKEAIKVEQIKCNDNVNEYLKLSSNADPTQNQRIKSVFEKNNQKSAQSISRLQKKLKRYDEDIKDIKERGFYNRHTRERLRHVGVNIKEGITGLSGGVLDGIRSGIHTAGETVIAKPKEFFKRNTGENLTEKNNSELSEQMATLIPESDYNHGSSSGLINSNSHSHSHSTKCTSDEESSSITSGSGHLGNHSQNNSAHQSNSPLRMKPLNKSKLTSFNDAITPTTSNPPLDFHAIAEFEQLCIKIEECCKDCSRLNEEIDLIKIQFQAECSNINQTVQDEKYRVERLEEQLNDLTELHQKEIENLKQTISDLEEKIQYQTEERHRDVHEMLESFQTRISRMEHQQHQHLQQLVNLDSLENSNARALVLKLINVLLTILQVVLLLVATIANILAPFLQTRMRIFTSAIVIIIFTFVFQHWPDLSVWTRQKIYENCIYFLSLIPFIPINYDG